MNQMLASEPVSAKPAARSRSPRRVLLATESLGAGNGGIARVARLMARVIGEEVAVGRLQGTALALSDLGRRDVFGLHTQGVERSRWRYAAHVQRAALSSTHFIYDFLGMARAHRLLAGSLRPMLAFVHGIEIWEAAAPKWLRAAARAQFLIANTEYTRDRAERLHGGFARARVCWLGTETDELPPPRSAPGGPPTVLILGRIDDELYKGHRELIACWPRVVAAVPDARLLIVGSGPRLATLTELANASSARAHIELRGFVAENQIESIWAETSVFAMPSRGEGFGLVYIEAMRHGIPVIASIHDAAAEINVDSATGYNVNLDRPDELPERLVHLLRHPDHAATLGRQGIERWRDSFSYQAFRARFLPLLHEFLAH